MSNQVSRVSSGWSANKEGVRCPPIPFAIVQQWFRRLAAFVPPQFEGLLMLFLLDDQSRDVEQSCLFLYTFL